MANKHTSGAAIVVFTLEAVVQIGAMWFPEWFAAHQAQIKGTINELQKMAVGYGLLMGADSPKKDDGTPAEPKSNLPRNIGLFLIGACGLFYFIQT